MQIENPVLAARKSLGLTQTEMAGELGVNLSTVWRWEKEIIPVSNVVKRAVEQLVEQRKTVAS